MQGAVRLLIPRNLPVIFYKNRLRFDRIMVLSLWPTFLAHPVHVEKPSLAVTSTTCQLLTVSIQCLQPTRYLLAIDTAFGIQRQRMERARTYWTLWNRIYGPVPRKSVITRSRDARYSVRELSFPFATYSLRLRRTLHPGSALANWANMLRLLPSARGVARSKYAGWTMDRHGERGTDWRVKSEP